MIYRQLTGIYISPIKKAGGLFKNFLPDLISMLSAVIIPAFIYAFLGFLLCTNTTMAQDKKETMQSIRSVAKAVLNNTAFQFIDQKSGKKYLSPIEAPTDSQLKPESPYNDWRYWNGVINIALMKLGQTLHDSACTQFVVKNIEFNFDNYGFFEKSYKGQDRWSYPFFQLFNMQELDDYGAMGGSLIEAYKLKPQERYKAYITKAANYITNIQNRMEDRTLVRAFPRKWTLWADDLYMSVSFLSRLGKFSGDSAYFYDAALQVVNFHKYLFDTTKGIMFHCWYSDTKKNGIAHWGRANGWALLAQVDLLDRLPKDNPLRNKLLALLKRHIMGIINYQDKDGLWRQVLDKPDSYLETSCSAMFTYAIARSVNMGYINKRFLSNAERGWNGIMTKIRPDGEIEGICEGTGVGDDLNFYYNRPTPLNDPHGIGAVLLTGTEMLKLIKK